MEIIISVGVIILILLVWVIVIYNSIIGKHNRAKRSWSDVIAYERLKNDVLPQLENMLGEYGIELHHTSLWVFPPGRLHLQ